MIHVHVINDNNRYLPIDYIFNIFLLKFFLTEKINLGKLLVIVHLLLQDIVH